MASTSPRFVDRLSLAGRKSPILPLHASGRRATDYSLDELSPRPDEPLFSVSPQMPPALSRIRSPLPADPWDSNPTSPVGSFSKTKPIPIFAGPPPPIAASLLLQPAPKGKVSTRGGSTNAYNGQDSRELSASRITIGNILFDQGSRSPSSSRVDSIWRRLQQRERSLQREVQHLLDMQATNLVSGGDAFDSSNDVSGLDTWSDSGSSTPTGTFYSTATSKSRMMASLDPPMRATARGDVIPVRQPKSSGPQGLRTARSGLRRSLAAFTELKAEEDDYLVAALSQRKKALAYLNKLDCRRMNITAELSILADDEEEPLAKELRELGAQHESLGHEIRELEERLVGMRNRHKWLGRKMEDVHNRREAGLSGYRGALKEVEGEITSLLRRPPIDPLDAEVVKVIGQSQPATTGRVTEVLGGEEFLRMIPTRRTLSMAKDWWEAEVEFLQKRKAQVDKDRDALSQGAALWQETTHVVTKFEADLRQSLDGSLASKGKRTPRAQQEAVDSMLSRMDKVIVELGDYLRTAEQKNWNLLICAIGAELEAFRKAEQLLRDSLPQAAKRAVGEVDEPWASSDDLSEAAEKAGARSSPPDSRRGESDDEVPAGLLVSRGEEEQESPAPSEPSTASSRRDSDNEVPPEFLAEHSNEGGLD